jgi:glycerol kinase
MKELLLALDQGTTSSRAIVFDQSGQIHAQAQREFTQIYPTPGWVEHNPIDIWQSQFSVARLAIQRLAAGKKKIAAIGIANQRETTLMWERATGKPVANAIVWQCRRTEAICQKLKKAGLEKEIKKRTGLLLDPYFSATKIIWLLENVPGLRRRAEKGEILFGTVDTWLLFNLTGIHATEPSNASRTMLYNIHRGRWDEELLRELKIPPCILPAVKPSSGLFGYTAKITGKEIEVTGMAGDQQAALFGQGCFRPGNAKNTYGTGCFLLMHTGKKPAVSRNNLLTTVAWDLGKGLEYALEGSIFIAGAALQWLRDELGLFKQVADTQRLAESVPDSGGCYFVPAFVGLGAPHWQANVRGTFVGLTRGTGRAQIVRAALESIAFQTRDLVSAMVKDSGRAIESLRVDGGACANDFLMQFQADILGRPVVRPASFESTARGAAWLAGLGAGIIRHRGEIDRFQYDADIFKPSLNHEAVKRACRLWDKAVAAAKTFSAK